MSQQQVIRSETTREKPNWWLRVLVGIVVIMASLMVLFLAVALFGAVTGEEFSPTRFRRRTFSYYEIPWIHLQVTGIARANVPSPLTAHLVKKKYIATAPTKKPRWDLVSHNRVTPTSSLCDSRILCSYLDAEDNTNVIWLKWSKKHPKLAQVFWPLVEKVARQGLYLFVPDLMDLAKAASDAQQFQKKIDLQLTDQYEQLAQTQQQLGQHETATRWYTEAISHDASRQSLLKGRAESYRALGKNDRAVADRKALEALEAADR